MPIPSYPNPYAGIGTGVTSFGNSIADALRKLEQQKQQEEMMNKLRSFMLGQGNQAQLTDWGSNAAPPAGQPAGTLPPPQSYGGQGYGAPVDWSSMSDQQSAGSNKGGGLAGGNKGGS